ncbi:hypothetical protein Zm00014a_028330 [Zea mays]|jgi:hypothetical protein|uniref:Uncharacterized protein n=2 Tax=Zea mays TaxID=4577 RepID=A0A3L6FGJ6_MAIZE|nr:uncharacterized protein LOC100275461 [Zea mays]ONM29816.1 hypothetical protein ZEAMMB73_Zm00001d039726 [Zea mays]PWZ32355.1 hypothetical protein Zm00014a_028330 [Zea mays]|eukprot:NP_001143000.2 uncharacterized protein LOC100275461 [Zea mays]
MAAVSSQDKEGALQLKQAGESKVFSKLFTRESSAAAPSFRVYYGVASAGSVPFLWESQPGTPKNDAVSTATLPPLTPPPSYYTARRQQHAAAARSHHRRTMSSSSSSSSAAGGTGRNKKKLLSAKHYTRIFSAILPKMILHRWSSATSSPSASSSSSSSSSSSRSAFSSSASASFRSARSPAACSSMTMRSRVFAFSAADEDGGEEEEEQAAAPMCFSVVRHESFRAFRGCRVAMTVKSALASVGAGGGHGHGAGPAAAQKV